MSRQCIEAKEWLWRAWRWPTWQRSFCLIVIAFSTTVERIAEIFTEFHVKWTCFCTCGLNAIPTLQKVRIYNTCKQYMQFLNMIPCMIYMHLVQRFSKVQIPLYQNSSSYSSIPASCFLCNWHLHRREIRGFGGGQCCAAYFPDLGRPPSSNVGNRYVSHCRSSVSFRFHMLRC